jgi:hypothetical protein
MSSPGKSASKSLRRSASQDSSPTPREKKRVKGSSKTATKRWRQDVRPRIIEAAVAATESLKWSPGLIQLLLDELYVDDQIEKLLAQTPGKLRSRQYPQAIALALILRHSWRADDLAWIVNRLGLATAPPNLYRRRTGQRTLATI